MYIDDEELRDLYKTAASEHVQSIESALMELEKNPENIDPLKDLLRAAHTLKGDSRMLGVEDVETLIHQIEECLTPISKGQAMLDRALCNKIYKGLDTIKQLAHTAVTGEPNQVNMFYVLSTLMSDGGKNTPPPVALLEVPSQLELEDDRLFRGDRILSDFDLLAMDLLSQSPSPPLPSSPLFPTDSTLPDLDSGAVFNDFDLISVTQNPVSIEDFSFPFGDDLTFRADEPIDLAFSVETDFEIFPTTDTTIDLQRLSFIEDVTASTESEEDLFPTFDDESISSTPTEDIPAPLQPIATPVTTTATQAIDTIRVEARQLDALMAQAGEINVINQQIASRLTDIEALVELWDIGSHDYRQIQTHLQQLPAEFSLHHHFNRTHQQWEEMGKLVNKFKQLISGDSSRLDLVTSALESGVKQLRLLPLTTIFKLFPRMVRDLAQTQAKEINFIIEGGDLLLDKRLLDEIKDPLMHILRNAVDHGIEATGERQHQDKPSAATLMIQVRQTGNQTTIEILDDGKGLDLKRIKATAIKRGLHSENQLAQMSDRQIHSLIFAPGFSTRSRVTELSGRGVGLDIVRTNVERLKGTVEVESIPGKGCTFRIQLTHSIGSSQVMMVDVRNTIYALPVEYVDRMLLLNKADIFALGGTPTTKIGGQTVTVAWLADLLQLPTIAPASPSEAQRTSKSVACLLLQAGQQQLALLVDGIRDRQIVTIEAPHPILKNVPHISGSTILGTGEVCLVLNPLHLFELAVGAKPLLLAPTSTADLVPADTPPSLLLVEDSLVIRKQMQRILGGAGYQVTVAVDGLEGWEKLQAGQFDLVISDVEMPRCNGLELTARIRQHAEYEDLPVILVTTLDRVADRDRGFQAGANAYLTKGDFDQKLLLETLTRLI